MKSKKLIELLQYMDPTGEVEVCINDADILDVQCEPAYWDGCLEVLERDENYQYYNVIGVRVTDKGSKISLYPHSVYDAIQRNPDVPIKVCSMARYHKERIKEKRKEVKALNKKLAKIMRTKNEKE